MPGLQKLVSNKKGLRNDEKKGEDFERSSNRIMILSYTFIRLRRHGNEEHPVRPQSEFKKNAGF